MKDSLSLVCLLFLLALPARAQELYPSSGRSGETLSVSVLTFQPGTVYWQRFGHNAILVRDRASGEDLAYNYGIFDFSEKNFLLNFARGYMNYRMAVDGLERDLDIYREDGRWVEEQKLNLTPTQRAALSDFLDWNARPENMRYRYDYFLSNCSTRVRDALDRVLGGALRKQLEAILAPISYRYDAVRLISPEFFAGLGMDVALGPDADRPLNLWQDSFVPMQLMGALRQVKVTDADGHEQPLVTSETRLLQSRVPEEPAQPPDWRLPFLAIGLGYAALLLALAWRRRTVATARIGFAVLATAFSLVCGTAGLILAALWGLTQHWSGWHNENLLLLDPLCLLLLPHWVRSAWPRYRPGRSLRRLAAIAGGMAAFSLVLRQLPGCYQGNLAWILLLLPPHAALLLALRLPAAFEEEPVVPPPPEWTPTFRVRRVP
ncbi:MAG: DUF4105 domain-containing protein [Nevskia sp.]|nr:DUF4105 domain-containing protein [Nevskia sp.]